MRYWGIYEVNYEAFTNKSILDNNVSVITETPTLNERIKIR